MKTFVVEIDDALAARLEAVASARSRRRSAFVREAIRKALWEAEERATRAAYEADPDSSEAVYWDSRVWEPSFDDEGDGP